MGQNEGANLTMRALFKLFSPKTQVADVEEARRKVTEALEKYGRVILLDVKDRTPRGKTGRLREGWVLEMSPMKAVIHNKADDEGQRILWILERGSVPHPIEPKTDDGWLHFYWEARSKWVRTKRVEHPGTIAYRMIEGAAEFFSSEKSQAPLIREALEYIDRAFESLTMIE